MIISVVGQSPRAALVYEPGESGSFFEKSPNFSRIFTVPAGKANMPFAFYFFLAMMINRWRRASPSRW